MSPTALLLVRLLPVGLLPVALLPSAEANPVAGSPTAASTASAPATATANSLHAATQATLARDPELGRLETIAGRRREALSGGARWSDPELRLGTAIDRQSRNDDTWQATVRQPVPGYGQLSAENAGTAAEAEIAAAEADLRRASLIRDLHQAWILVLRRQQEHDLAQRRFALAEERATLLATLSGNGRSGIEIATARLKAGSLRAAARSAALASSTAEAQLTVLAGPGPWRPDADEAAPESLTDAQGRRLRAEAAKAQADADQVGGRALPWPTFVEAGIEGGRDSGDGAFLVKLGISIPLWHDREAEAVARQAAEAQLRRAGRLPQIQAAARDAARQRVAVAEQSVGEAEAALADARTQTTPLRDQAAAAGQRLAAIDLDLALLDLEQALAEARTACLAARLDEADLPVAGAP